MTGLSDLFKFSKHTGQFRSGGGVSDASCFIVLTHCLVYTFVLIEGVNSQTRVAAVTMLELLFRSNAANTAPITVILISVNTVEKSTDEASVSCKLSLALDTSLCNLEPSQMV